MCEHKTAYFAHLFIAIKLCSDSGGDACVRTHYLTKHYSNYNPLLCLSLMRKTFTPFKVVCFDYLLLVHSLTCKPRGGRFALKRRRFFRHG